MLRLSSLFSGKALVGWTLVVAAGMAALFFSRHGVGEEGAAHLIRATARLSAFLFGMGFLAPAPYRLWPGSVTAWLRDQEVWLLASLVASHLCHGVAIGTSAWVTGGASMEDQTLPGVALGASVYLVLITLGVSSVLTRDGVRSRRHRLQRGGALGLLWLAFFRAYATRFTHEPLFALLALLYALGLALRIAAALWARRLRDAA